MIDVSNLPRAKKLDDGTIFIPWMRNPGESMYPDFSDHKNMSKEYLDNYLFSAPRFKELYEKNHIFITNTSHNAKFRQNGDNPRLFEGFKEVEGGLNTLLNYDQNIEDAICRVKKVEYDGIIVTSVGYKVSTLLEMALERDNIYVSVFNNFIIESEATEIPDPDGKIIWNRFIIDITDLEVINKCLE